MKNELTESEPPKAKRIKKILLTKAHLIWCRPMDVIYWLSKQASIDGDYQKLENFAMLVDSSASLVVPLEQWEASAIGAAVLHIPALPSFIDAWDTVMYDQGTLEFTCKNKIHPEYANCRMPFNTSKKRWKRSDLEKIWDEMSKGSF